MLHKKEPYWNCNLPIENRIKDLLKRMTVEEKVKQLCSVIPKAILTQNKLSLKKARQVLKQGMGQISRILLHYNPADGARLANEIQKFALEHTRLGIPIMIHEECIHGCTAKGSTMFPVSIGLGSTWDPELLESIAQVIGKEASCRGIHQALSPTINIARDVRVGRTQETYGEDVYLTSRMAVAFIKGLQSQNMIATPKHFTANFVGDGGRDSNAIHFSERMLREIYFPVFEASIREAGALSLMAAYNSLDGLPCSCNRWLLTDILRKEWGFKGFVVSDYWSIRQIHSLHYVATTKAEAAQKAVEAGLDVELPYGECFNELVGLVKKGIISHQIINERVKNVLYVKFKLGLFETPYVDQDYAKNVCNTKTHRMLSLEAARKSMVLLKNHNNLLPLNKNIKSLAVIGPNARIARLGDYRGSGIKIITPLESIKSQISPQTKLFFAKGCEISGNSKKGFGEAIRIARRANAVIMVMGNVSLGTEGEFQDRCNLDLPGMQSDLIKTVCTVNKNVIVVLVNGSAITMTQWIKQVPTVIESWYSGEEGGQALAEIIFGDYNPGGKLPLTFPKTTGQLPFYYNYKPSGRVNDYVDLRKEQFLFPFGHGLSYTKFIYSNLRISKSRPNGRWQIKVNCTIKNIGRYKGDEVVQLYIRDVFSRLSRPVKELKEFRRITLAPHEKQTIEFILDEKVFTYLDEHINSARMVRNLFY